jgi:hypothetical protein
MNVSLVVPFGPLRPEQVLPCAGLLDGDAHSASSVRSGPAQRLWQGQSVEPHQSFAFVAGSGYRIPAGTCVTLGAPAVAGFGPGASALHHSPLGEPGKIARATPW